MVLLARLNNPTLQRRPSSVVLRLGGLLNRPFSLPAPRLKRLQPFNPNRFHFVS